MRAPSATPLHAAKACLFVATSSILGLGGEGLLEGEGAGLPAFLVKVWTTSLFADAVFVAGSIAGLALALRIARERGLVVGCLASLGLQALVYVLSFAALSLSWRGGAGMAVESIVSVPLSVGIAGLVFCTLAPALAVKLGWAEARNDIPALD
jgi:hypothetical protein